MTHLFILNGKAGKGKRKREYDRLLDSIRAFDGEQAVAFTDPPAWGAEQIARSWAQRGIPLRIYACGGDGTLNEVVNGAAGYDHVAVTNVPLGTGNDFLKLFGPDYRRLFSDLPALAAGPQSQFDLIECNDRLGIDVVCAGLDARVAADVDRYKNWPLVSGPGAYVLSLVTQVLFRGIARPMRVSMGEVRWDGDVSLLCVCNGRHYGGGFMPVGDAMPDDGILDALLVPKVSLFTFLRLVRTYAKGGYKRLRPLVRDFHGQEISVSSPQPMVAVVDGEVMRDEAFSIRLSSKQISFFYPADADYACSPSLVGSN